MDGIAMSTVLRARHEGGGTPVLDQWGADSEYGVLREVLLGSADAFRWLGEDNARYSALVRSTLRKGYRFDREYALRQYAEMVDAYRSAGVAVHELEARDDLAYGAYSRDSSVMTPFGAIVCQLANPRRRGEYATTLRFYVENGIPIYDLVSIGNFEGGDFALIEPGCALIGFTGNRSEEVAAQQVGGWLAAEGIEVVYAPIDEYYVHIDVLVCMLGEKLAAVCIDAVDPEILDWLRGKRIEIMPVSFRDTMGLGCNVMSLGNDRVLSMAQSGSLNEHLRALGFTVYDPDLSQFTLAGGGVHCLAQPLRRDPA
jgi:N-dimethylarginine dimethylaminohydrolase